MFYEFILVLCAVLLAMMVRSALNLRKEIRQLSLALDREKRKRSFPLLALDLDIEGRSLYITNESYCYAKNITFDDLELTIHLGFQKHLRLRFDSIDILKPGKREKIHFRVFDHDHEITSPDSPNLIYYFPDTKIVFEIRYQNIEEEHFKMIIANEGKEFKTTKTETLDETDIPQKKSSKKKSLPTEEISL